MKVLVYFNPGRRNDCFQGTRLRKNIKGSLELNAISWVESLFAFPDIVHLLSPDDETKAHDAKEDNLKVVVSCGYCEADSFARYFNKDADGLLILKSKAERILEGADLIFVPAQSFKDLLIAAGIKNPHIRIVSPGVNISRFEKGSKVEASVFYRYMRLPEETKLVIGVGNYDDEGEIASFRQIAEVAPNERFYFFGETKSGRPLAPFLKKLNHDSPNNCRFLDVLEDDVFRSAMMSASVYFTNLTLRPDYLTSLEAMAAKTQIIALGKAMEGDPIVDKKTAYCYDKEEKVGKAIESYCYGKLTPTIIEGYKTAKSNTLAIVGSQLKAYYESILKDSEE